MIRKHFKLWAIYLACVSLLIYLIGRIFPRSWIKEDKFPFNAFKFEKNGKIYEKLRIKSWKTKYPDASLLMHKLFKKIPVKRIENNSPEKTKVLVKESCVAEITHEVAIVACLIGLIICCSVATVILSIIYILVQIPPIIIQRYNRPRLKKIARLSTC